MLLSDSNNALLLPCPLNLENTLVSRSQTTFFRHSALNYESYLL